MLWLVIFVALLISLAVVVLDSPVVRSAFERRHGGLEGPLPSDVKELARKVGVMEEELDALRGELGQLQEKHEFLQRLLSDPADRQPAKLPKPTD